MSSDVATTHESLFDRVLADAIAERGHPRGSYELFLTSGEGRLLPISSAVDPVEEYSGYIVTNEGHHFLFWLGWDEKADRATMIHWDPVDPPTRWFNNPEYLKARKEVGLPDEAASDPRS